MDDRQFDDMTRVVGRQSGRRGMLKAAAGGVLGLVGLSALTDGALAEEMQERQRLSVEQGVSQQKVRRMQERPELQRRLNLQEEQVRPKCKNNTDCNRNEFCVKKECVECKSDRDCNKGQKCTNSGRCKNK